MDPACLGFRPMTLDDLPQLHRWLNVRHVREWWSDAPTTLEGVTAKYGPRIRGEEPTDCYIILHDGQPIGYIQTYRVTDYPEYAAAVQGEEGAAGLDLFIGEAAFLHEGLGAPLLRRFLAEVVFAAGARSCVVGPEPANQAAIRAYEKAGFRYLRTVTIPGEEQPEYLMSVTPEGLAATA